MTQDKTTVARIAERRQLRTDVEFFVAGDIERATAVDVSETGIRFETQKPIAVRMRLEIDDKQREFLARLVWARKNPDGTMAYGLEFIPDLEENTF